MSSVHTRYDELFNLTAIFKAWEKFRRGKTGKNDVMHFGLHVEDNLFGLYDDLHNGIYKHSAYTYFQIFDNKKRDIYKAEVRDRVVHQIIFDYLVSLFEPEFISDSYASRTNKGQYKALHAFRYFITLAHTTYKPCFVLKCDIRKYFDSIDQVMLLDLIKEKVSCEKTLEIIKEILCSHVSSLHGKGVPLGNITSQIFANIYLHTLDVYIKKELGCRLYVRYNDDFVVVSESSRKLEEVRVKIILFAKEKLLLDIPLEKTSIRKVSWGIDFLGFIILPKAVLLRNKTKSKMYARISPRNAHSYLGILKHCNSYNLKRKLLSIERLGEIW